MPLARPEVLLLLPFVWGIVIALALLGRRGAESKLRTALAVVVRSAVLGLVVVALAGPYRSFVVEEPTGTALLADRSGSVSPEGRALADDWRASLADGGRVDTTPFGSEDSSDARPAALAAAGSDVARIVLATDGHLEADAALLLRDLRASGRVVGVVPLASERGEEPAPLLTPPVLHVPPAVREDSPFTLEVEAPGAVEVDLLVDGKPVGRVPVESGAASFPDLSLAAGRHRLAAVAERPGARSAASVEVDVAGPLRVLVLGAGPDAAVPRALSVQGLDVSAEDPVDGIVPDLERARVVVALPSFRLPASGEPLREHVRRGGGLLVASGPPPGLSRYLSEPVADLLPATPEPEPPEAAPPPPEPPEEEPPDEGARPAEVEKEAATLTLLLVLDRSGSMRGEKIAMARAACLAAAGTLDRKDRIAVLAFNETHEWIVAPSPAWNVPRLRTALGRYQAQGGTEIFPALREAYRAMSEETTSVRHVILASDGQDALMGFHKLVTSMRNDRITVSTIGIGRDYDANFLGSLARWGAGQFHAATDPRDLPRLVTLDARQVVDAARPPEGEPAPDVTAGSKDPETPPPEEERPPEPPPGEPVAVRAESPLPFLEGLAFPTLPEVSPSTPRFPAQVALSGGEDPVLLVWRYGAGRVALFTGDPGAWIGWEDLPRFLAQVVRLLAGAEGEGGGPAPVLSVAGGEVEVETEGPLPSVSVRREGEELPVALMRVGPGRWRGLLPEGPEGALLEVEARVDGGRPATATLVSPPGHEAGDRGIDAAEIERLAGAAGGSPGRVPSAPPPRRRPGREPRHLPFLLAALLLLPVDVAARRLFR